MPGNKAGKDGTTKENKQQSLEYVFYWRKKQEELAGEYEEKTKAESARFHSELDRIREAAAKEKEEAAARRRAIFEQSSADLRHSLRLEAERLFPLPKIVISFDADGETLLSLGRNDTETAAKIEELSAAAVKTTVEIIHGEGKTAGERTVSSISFTKADAASITFIRNDVKIRFGKPRERTKEFNKMKDAIVAFDDAFGGRTDIGEDYLSSAAQLADMREKLQKIAETSKRYFETHKSYRFTDEGKRRVQVAKNTYAMALSKIAAIDAAVRASEEAAASQGGIERRREDYTEAGMNEASQKNEAEISREQAEIDAKREAQESGVVKEHSGKMNELQNMEKKQLSDIETQRIQSQKYIGYSDLNRNQKYAVNNARFAAVLFEEKHNPFAAYLKDVPVNGKPGEIAVDREYMKDAVPLTELLASLKRDDARIPATYNIDALTTLCNLQLYDSMTGAQRQKNDYKVSCEFVKVEEDGKLIRLPASALDGDDGFRKLSEEGYMCFITGIKADFIKNTADVYGPGSAFTISERSIIPMETATRIAGLSDTYPETDIFWEHIEDEKEKSRTRNTRKKRGAELSEPNPADTLGSAFRSLKTKLLRRADANMLGDSPYEWQKFNIISTKALKRDVASDNIDFRPVRPGIRLRKKTYHRSGLVADHRSEKYFDAGLMANLEMNTSEVTEIGHKFEDEFAEKLLSEKSLILRNKSLRSDALNSLMEQPGDDPKLSHIMSLMQEVIDMNADDVLKYDVKYVTDSEISAEQPDEDIEYLTSETCENHFDLKASELYTAITRYVNEHTEDLKSGNSPAYLLNQWKNKAYPKGVRQFDEKDPNCIIVNAAGEGKDMDDLLTFDGDGDYLCGAELSFKSTDYWDCEDDQLNAAYGTDKREFYMKDFRDAPLFTREPSLSDMKQGQIGNCYFLACATAAIGSDPMAIKDMMRDNGDGTVTCRFFNDKNQPVFVTVNKTVPYVRCPGKNDPAAQGELYDIPASGEKAPLWFHILQKAYVLSGLRTIANMTAKDQASAWAAFEENSSVKGEGASESLRTRILNVRFKNTGNRDELVANATDKLYDRIINHTMQVMDGGLAGNVYRHFTGNKARNRSIPSMSGRETIAALRSVDIDSNCFCGNRLAKKNLSPQERDVLREICKKAADRLTIEKTRYSKDMNGHDFVTAEKVNMDDILSAVKDAASELAVPGTESAVYDPMQVYGLFSEAMTDYQMNDPDPDKVFVSSEPGRYSVYANTTFDVIRAHLSKDHGVTCSFNSLSDSGNKDLDIPGTNLFISDGGMISNHAFNILGCMTDNGKKILLIRNPWGGSEKVRNSATMIAPDGKTEDISYSTLAGNDENTRENGVFKMELNEFMEFGKNITFMPKEPSLKYDAVVNNLASRYLKVLAEQNPAQYKKVIEANGYETVLEKTKESSVIREYADEIFEIDDITKDGEDGKNVSPAKLKKLEKFKEELNSAFAVSKAGKAGPEDAAASKRTEEKPVQTGKVVG